LKALLPYCAENDIGVIPYSPMMSGLLTGECDRESIRSLPDDDWRKDSAHFTEPELNARLNLIERLRSIADRNDKTLAQLAVAWILRRQEVTGAIVGAQGPDQIEGTEQTAEWQLSEENLTALESLLQKREQVL
jgi:aryl-alcohol dehydrogenase-like predicted oxidoreductase